ncbi:MAG: hypothetical protein ACJ72D_04130 [Marmoricola sp.]
MADPAVLLMSSATVPVVLAAPVGLSVIPLRSHAATYPAGGPVIAVPTAVLLSRRTRTTVAVTR